MAKKTTTEVADSIKPETPENNTIQAVMKRNVMMDGNMYYIGKSYTFDKATYNRLIAIKAV